MKKYKINVNRSKISSDEIASRRDFDAVLKSYSKPLKPFYKTTGFLAGTVAAVVTLVGILAYVSGNSSKEAGENSTAAFENTTYQPGEDRFGLKGPVQPSAPGAGVEFTTYSVNAAKGAELAYVSGSQIKVPAGAFIDEQGNMVKGEVELRYREFPDPAGLFASGIPATCDSGGIQYQLEDAIVLEITAYQDGKLLAVNPAKSINVELASSYDGNDHNVYFLDTVKNNWMYKGKDKVKKVAGKEKSSVQQYNAADPVLVSMIEEKTAPIKKEAEKVSADLAGIKSDIEKMEKGKPEAPKGREAYKGAFDIDADASEFPELAVYKNIVWGVGTENTNFSKEMYKIEWDDAVLSEGPKKGVSYRLTLTKDSQSHTLIVYPILTGKNYEKAMQEYKEKFEKYEAALDKRRADEKMKQEEHRQLLGKMEEEKKKQQRLWEQQAALNQQSIGQEKPGRVYRAFQVNRFGLWNSGKAAKGAHPNL